MVHRPLKTHHLSRDDWIEEEPPEFDWHLCPSDVTLPQGNTETCKEFVVSNSLPMEGFRSMNYGVNCERLGGQRLCLPLTCPTSVVEAMQSVQDLVESGDLGTVTMTQFMAWNMFLSERATVLKGDTVCVG